MSARDSAPSFFRWPPQPAAGNAGPTPVARTSVVVGAGIPAVTGSLSLPAEGRPFPDALRTPRGFHGFLNTPPICTPITGPAADKPRITRSGARKAQVTAADGVEKGARTRRRRIAAPRSAATHVPGPAEAYR
ncbi:hypothetical protein GCM10010267_34530 [Streptomyces griseorubens]|nr:hypothetical protein GCM10010267_34530 [Streptomyces griseorubens]